MNLRLISIFIILGIMAVADFARAWDIDWSHHQKGNSDNSTTTATAATVDPETVVPATEDVKEAPQRPHSNLEGLVDRENHPSYADKQEFVILNTEHGFIPSNVRLHKGIHYVVHVVNVNQEKKNVSFMLDAFNQHYATYYGDIRTFDIDADKTGVFEFECPETSSTGRLVILGPGNMPPTGRMPSSSSGH